MQEKEILINQLFAGKYLEEGENIGHEIINLFRSDDGSNYIYITPSGIVKGHNIESVLFVRNIQARRTVEVIALAEGLSEVTKEEVESINYAGVSLAQIFKSNTYKGGPDVFLGNVSFRAERIRMPSHRIFITVDKEYQSSEDTVHLVSERKVVIPQGMREYYSEDNDTIAYSQLKSLIKNSSCWEEENTTQKLIAEGAVHNQPPSFLEVIRKEDDEIIFSNLLAYFFDYSHSALQRFASDPKLFDIPDMSVDFSVTREAESRVDLWIESEEDIIVIENKIKSGINGIVSNDYSQLNKYRDVAERKAKELNKKVHFYIFAPDYAKFDLSEFGLDQVYKLIHYSDIYNFFVKEAVTYIADRAFPDFVRGLERHTLTLSELQFRTMRSRLLKKISQLQ